MERRAIFASLPGAALSGAVSLVCAATGFGAYLRYDWFLGLPVLLLVSGLGVALLARALSTPLPLRSAGLAVVLGALLFPVGWWGGDEIRLIRCRSVASRADPLIRAVEEFRRDRGSWPKALSDVSGWDSLVRSAGISVQVRGASPLGLDTTDLAEADVTLYFTGPDELVSVIPVERAYIMSITSFRVLLRGGQSSAWVEDRFIWTLSAPE